MYPNAHRGGSSANPVMRAYSRINSFGSLDAVMKTSIGSASAAGVSVPSAPVRSNAPSGWRTNMPQPSVLTSHGIGTRPPCVRSWYPPWPFRFV